MAKYQIARELGNKEVVTSDGEKIGLLSDMKIDEKSGRIISAIVKPQGGRPRGLQVPIDEAGHLVIPYDQIVAVGELMIVKTGESAEIEEA